MEEEKQDGSRPNIKKIHSKTAAGKVVCVSYHEETNWPDERKAIVRAKAREDIEYAENTY